MSTPHVTEIIPASVKPRIFRWEGEWHVVGGQPDAHEQAYIFACALNALGR